MAVLRLYNNSILSDVLATQDSGPSPQISTEYQATVPWYGRGWTTLVIALLFTYVGVSAICLASWLVEGVIDWRGNWLYDRPDRRVGSLMRIQRHLNRAPGNRFWRARERMFVDERGAVEHRNHFRNVRSQFVGTAPSVAETIIDYSDDENIIEPFHRASTFTAQSFVLQNLPFLAPARLHMTYAWIESMELEHLRALAGAEGGIPERAYVRERGLQNLAHLRRELEAWEAARMRPAQS